MSKALTASERATLLRYASSLPKGNETRRAILAAVGEPTSKYDYPYAVAEELEGLYDQSAWKSLPKNIAEATHNNRIAPDMKADLKEVFKLVQESRAKLEKALIILGVV